MRSVGTGTLSRHPRPWSAILAVSAALLLLVTAFRAADFRQVRSLEPHTRWEQWLDQVPVAGGVIVGVMSSAAPGRVDPRFVLVDLPPRPAGQLCLEVSSQDGRYSGRLEYDVGRVRGRGPVRLYLHSEHEGRLRRYGTGELAVLARLGGRCGDHHGAYVPAAWNGRRGGDTVYVLVNSRVPTDVIGGTAGRRQHEARCLDLRGVTTAFNLRCAVPGAWIAPGTEFFLRMREGLALAHIELPLRVR
jgi:hypothetical protein